MMSPIQLPGAGPAGPATSASPPTTHNAIPDFALGRPTFTHTNQTDQVGAAPPPAQPIDFESNPDVLALKSAISILQLQRARATADIQSLSRARDAAMANPQSFVADLATGKVRVDGDPLFSGARPAARASSDSSDSDSDSDSDSSSDRDDDTANKPGPSSVSAAEPDTVMIDNPPNPAKGKQKRKGKTATTSTTTKPPAWQTLPKPQTVIRCPPINWAQYGVVGESLDKLHAEQVAAPTPGAPAALGPGGAFEFKAGAAGGGGAAPAPAAEPARRLVGIAAPYSPMRDKLEKKSGRGAKR